jgi:hypothetical protein
MELLAADLAVSAQFISLLENGRRHPSPDLVARCAARFEADSRYVGFLAMRMPVEEKRALAESPGAPEYIPRELRRHAGAFDGEESLLRKLLLPPGLPPPEADGPHVPSGPLGPGDAVTESVIDRILRAGSEFSPKAQGWAVFHEAYITRATRGRLAALSAFERLEERMASSEDGVFGRAVRHLTSLQLSMALRDAGRGEEAKAFARGAGDHAADGSDADGVARAAVADAALRRDDHDPLAAAEALSPTCEDPALGGDVRARCLVLLADLWSEGHQYQQTRRAVLTAVPLLRTTSLAMPTKERTGLLLRAQVAMVEALVELGDLDAAAEWLNRARSLRPRAPATSSDGRLRAAVGLLFLERGRAAAAARKVAPLLEAPATGAHVRRRAMRVAGRAAARKGDYETAHARAVDLLDTPTTGVLVQDVAAAGWALLIHCEAHHGEGARREADGRLDDLDGRLHAAVQSDPRLANGEAVRALRAAIARWRETVAGG